MQCKTCEYRLWNLRARQCPECGTAFLPSEYEFVPHSVAFCCPHCEQPYYGTSVTGHLEPIEFDCVKCGRHVHMDQMVLRPTDSVPETLTRPDANPWLDRRNRNWFGAFFTTMGRGMVNPGKLLHVTPVGSPANDALWFAFINLLLFTVIGMIVFIGFVIAMLISGNGGAEMLVVFTVSMAPLVGGLLFLGLWGLTTHALMCIGVNKPVAGIGRTYQALCYTAGCNVFYAVPCFNMYVAWIGWAWWTVSAALAMKEAQRVSATRATVSVCALPAACVLTIVGLIVGTVAYSFTSRGVYASGPAVSHWGEAQTITTALQSYASAHQGAGPGHAIELVDGGSVFSHTFIAGGVSGWNMAIGNTTLGMFDSLTPAHQQAAVQAAIASVPAGAVAHRVGDIVFTYHGIDFDTADPNLWAMIVWPDQPMIPPEPHTNVSVGLVDGTVTDVTFGTFQTELAAQNALRAKYQLPPIPHPATVVAPQQGQNAPRP